MNASNTTASSRTSKPVAVPLRLVVRALLTAMVLLHVLNLVAQSFALSPDSSDAAITFAQLFTVNAEGKIPTWYSAATLLLCAGLLAVIGLSPKTTTDRRHWWVLAAVFAFISMDEASSFHEEVGAHLQSTLQTSGMWANAWMIPALVFVLVFGIAMLRFVLRLPRATQMQFVLAGGLYVGGALGMELISSAYLAGNEFDMGTSTYALMATLEELLEMTGIVVFAWSLLSYMQAHDITLPTIALPWKRIGAALLVAIGLIGVAGVIGQVSTYAFGHGRLLGFVRLFHLDGEGNTTTWFSSMLLLSAAGTCALCALSNTQPRMPRMWWILTAAFAAFSLDEFASLHELSSESLQRLWQTSGLLHYPWVIAGALVAIVVFVLCARDLLRMPRAYAVMIVVSGSVFVSGALGIEVIGAWWSSSHGEANMTYQFLVAGEEMLELSGAALFVLTLGAWLSQHPVELRVELSQPMDRALRLQSQAAPSRAA